jgi:hypothetical protein
MRNDTVEVFHVKWGPCHHGMALPRVAAVGDGLQLWKVDGNMLNKQLRGPTRGGPPAWGLGDGVTTRLRRTGLLRNVTQGLGSCCVYDNEPSGSIKGWEFLD